MKMKSRQLTLAVLLLTAAAATFTACNKEKDDDSDTSIASDTYRAQKEADDILAALNSAAYDNSVDRVDAGDATLLPECAEVFIDTTATPRKITIVFDSTGTGCLCSDWDGKYRKGTIEATWTGKYKDPGTTITVKTINYFVNGDKHEYNKSVVNNGQNANGHLEYAVNISQCKITYANGETFSMTSQRTREFMEGENSLTPYDDVYHITGSANGTTRNGTAFTWNITSPLDILIGCKWIRKGIVVISPSGKAARTLDFGNGSCDSQATVEINGTAYNINL